MNRVPTLTDNQLARDVWAAWRPPPPLRVRQWIPANVRIPGSLETPGEFDVGLYPHVEEVLDAVDDPTVRRILLDWATRNGKTLTAAALLIALVANTGRPGLLASVDEDRADDTIASTLYPLLEACDATRHRIKKERERNRREVLIGNTKIRRAYAGSKGTLAGYPACYVLANEVSLWPLNMVQRAIQRAKLFGFDSKLIFEGKPETVGACTITALIQADTTDRRYRYVKCPHCGTYQRLVWGDGAPDTPGVKWKKPAGAKHSDPIVAAETAWYRCESGCRVENDDRPAMMRAGRWLSEGQSIDRQGRITGQRKVESENVAFTGLSTLYSLAISGWGQIVAEFFDCRHDRELMREFQTGTLCIPWDPAPRTIQPHELADRLGVDEPLRVCPEWSRFLTAGADVGQVGDTLIFYPWVSAWGLHGRGQLIDYRIVWGADEMRRVILELAREGYPHADGGAPLRVVRGGIDSGSFTEAVYSFVAPLRSLGWWPLKGSSKDPDRPFHTGADGGIEFYKLGFQRTDVPVKLVTARVKLGQADLILPNTRRTQQRLENYLTGLVGRDAPDAYTIPRECFEGDAVPGVDFAEQLLADFEDEHGHWKRRGPNEARDSWRYSLVMAWHFKRNGQDWARDTPRGGQRGPRPRPRQRPPAGPGGGFVGGGRSFLATDR